MSLSKVLFIVASLIGAHIACTPPVPPALETDRKLERVRMSLVAPYVKAIFWMLALTEIAAILANNGAVSALPALQGALRMLWLTENAGKLRIVPQSALGALLSLYGGTIRIACYSFMGKQFTFDVSILRHHKLITNGPYSIVRHPAYTGSLMMLGGTILFHASPGSLFRESGLWNTNLGRVFFSGFITVTTLFPVLFLRYRMQIEDEALKSEFGQDWNEWARKVPYWLIPGVY